MIDLIFPNKGYNDLKTELLKSDLETSAILHTKVVPVNEGFKLLVEQIYYPYSQAYEERTTYSAQLKPEYVAPLVKRAKLKNLGIVFVHSHPGIKSIPHFSLIDDKGEAVLNKFIENRGVSGPHVALVIGESGCYARKLASNQPLRVLQVGQNLNVIFDPLKPSMENAVFDRQVRAFGEQGQERIKRLKVGIVGLGGTGSLVAQQLAHLGIEQFLLIDPDTVEETNLNRLSGATADDIGISKVTVAERYIRSVRPSASIFTNQGTILDDSTAKLLIGTDFIFCCTDSHGSRAVLNQLAYQYLIPCIDMGVGIISKQGKVTHIAGRVQMLSPGLSCLICGNLLDSDAIRLDLMTSEHRLADPYIIGDPQAQPAVMSLNSTMASLAVTMFLSAVTGIPSQARYQIYNGITGTLRPVIGSADPTCVACSTRGALGKGNEWPLPTRQK